MNKSKKISIAFLILPFHILFPPAKIPVLLKSNARLNSSVLSMRSWGHITTLHTLNSYHRNAEETCPYRSLAHIDVGHRNFLRFHLILVQVSFTLSLHKFTYLSPFLFHSISGVAFFVASQFLHLPLDLFACLRESVSLLPHFLYRSQYLPVSCSPPVHLSWSPSLTLPLWLLHPLSPNFWFCLPISCLSLCVSNSFWVSASLCLF